ncbi:TonB family C-terminal domain-containing protein [Tenacibaculum sp. MAR_2009_124]|uniref:energy transducer TonB n=1 Tax=Tenacibaculum sp. MAR_2009_124 TaxID=1250059 RepID=UPI000894A74F|nr:energy transducer TonB [Tenacibaculum sp. MAR_2009_124]SEC33172.1 TonB family C-terminal domain-containing protein [Tenacibaculum sp. MAR_2009_124]
MKRIIVLIVLLILSLETSAQEVCETPKEDAADLNSITKCSIKPSKNSKNKRSRQITVKVSASKRFLKKRETIKKQKSSGLGNLSTAGVSSLNTTGQGIENNQIATSSLANEETTAISSSESKSKNLKNNLESLTEKLSREEVKKAERFSTVGELPSFDACDGSSDDERLDCFNLEMIKHIQKHFRYPSEAVRGQIEGEVWVRFIIDKNGYVKNIKTLGPKGGELLNEEAKRVVTKLPRFAPAKKNGRSVSVKYGFPINFSLEE